MGNKKQDTSIMKWKKYIPPPLTPRLDPVLCNIYAKTTFTKTNILTLLFSNTQPRFWCQCQCQESCLNLSLTIEMHGNTPMQLVKAPLLHYNYYVIMCALKSSHHQHIGFMFTSPGFEWEKWERNILFYDIKTTNTTSLKLDLCFFRKLSSVDIESVQLVMKLVNADIK